MKTFKLISLQIVQDNEITDIPLVDGLIINREDERNTWLIEACIDKSYFDFFQQAKTEGREIFVQAVISKKENDPAPFVTKVRLIKKMNHHISVLLDGLLRRSKKDYAELLLNDLLEKGLFGEELLTEFKLKMKTKPRLVVSKEQATK